MSAVLIGFLLVTASAAAFGAVLFGRRPVPQIAMDAPAIPRDGSALKGPPDTADGGSVAAGHAGTGGPSPAHRALTGIGRGRIVTGRGERLRAAVLLLLGAAGAAILLGAVLGILVVAAVLVVS